MKNKEVIDKLKKNYIKVPGFVLDLELTPGALKLYVFLLRLPAKFNPSITYMSKKLKTSRKTVYRQLEELVVKQLLLKTQAGNIFNKTTARYEFVVTRMSSSYERKESNPVQKLSRNQS